MNWFNGKLEEAIGLIKTNKKILLVYLYGKDNPHSETLLQSLLSCSDLMDNFISIRLEAASVEAAQLNVYYPVLVIPLIYLINHEGCALSSVCGPASAEEVRQKLTETLKPSSVNDAGEPSTTTSDAALPSTSTPEAPISASEEAGAGESDSPKMSITERAEYARQKLEAVRQLKEEEDKDKEKNREIERRSVGRQMTRLREQQREQEQKELKEELRRRKMEEKEARERVKRQIEEDRRERNARLAAANPAPTSNRPSVTPSATSTDGASVSAASGSTRLQFRLPDGTNIVHVFNSNDRLRVAFDFITDASEGRFGDLVLSSLYPRRRFGRDDMDSTLTALGLSPSSAIAVSAGSSGRSRSGQVSGGAGASRSPVEFVLSPLMTLWAIIWGLLTSLFSSFSRPSETANNNASSPSDTGGAASGVGSGQREGEDGESVRRRPRNITRLGDLPRDGDDTNTWNGNSTQQM